MTVAFRKDQDAERADDLEPARPRMDDARAVVHEYAKPCLQRACNGTRLAGMDPSAGHTRHIRAGREPSLGKGGADPLCVGQLGPCKAFGHHRLRHLDTGEQARQELQRVDAAQRDQRTGVRHDDLRPLN